MEKLIAAPILKGIARAFQNSNSRMFSGNATEKETAVSASRYPIKYKAEISIPARKKMRTRNAAKTRIHVFTTESAIQTAQRWT